jgi:trehalose-6-phosphate synthase
VNPYDQDELAQSIREALDMPEEEKKTRLRSLKATVRKLDVHAWADGFLDSLEQAN